MWQRVRLSEDGKLPQCSLALARPALPWAALREWAVKRLLVGLWWVRPGVRSRAGFCSPPGPRGPIGSRGSLHLCSHAELWTGGELMGASFLPATSSHPGRRQRPRPRKPWCPGCCHLHAHVCFIQEPGLVWGRLWRTLADGRPSMWGVG